MAFQKNIQKKMLPVNQHHSITSIKIKPMKNTIISAIAMAFIFTDCSSNNTKSESTTSTTANAAKATQAEPKTTESKPTSTAQSPNFSIGEIVTNYLKMKNALTKDDAKEAANAGNAIVATLATLDMKSLTKEQMKSYMDVADDAKEHAEHIGANSGKIDHQREHFALLSKDVADLLKTFGSSQKLYQDFCPMYDDGKGAIWISEFKEIKNPYFGNKMLSCGSVKKEF